MYSSTTATKELSFSLFMCFRSLTLDTSKLYFVEMETSNNCFIANVNRYTCSNLIKTDNYFRINCCLVINFKQNRFEINKIPYDIYYKVFSNIYRKF